MQHQQMIIPPVNHFLYSLVLSLALPCARPENLGLSAQCSSTESVLGQCSNPVVVSVRTALHAGPYLWLCQRLALCTRAQDGQKSFSG